MHKPLTLLTLPALLVLLLFLSGCAILNTSTPTNDSTGLYSDDAARASLISALHDKDAKQTSDMAVMCFDATVFIMGHASKDFQNYAVHTARKTPGVANVITHWFASASKDKMEDAAIAANIDSAIFLDKELSSTRMAVEVFDGQVILCGVMKDRHSVNKAIEIARRINKVKSVTSYLSY